MHVFHKFYFYDAICGICVNLLVTVLAVAGVSVETPVVAISEMISLSVGV